MVFILGDIAVFDNNQWLLIIMLQFYFQLLTNRIKQTEHSHFRPDSVTVSVQYPGTVHTCTKLVINHTVTKALGSVCQYNQVWH